ncbi:restriction endonuclease subunit S [Enterococcus faecium]|uniref:restriction endonuclease subunit S n=1 Tax=Enterococcus faecium TaxID=1352 RepID=UPI002953A0C3|nr:restriction endonuclease subunit S [Enterococcus faecium]MDV7727309.1 restriction endonuclease subunit S [Enterococcus faecium]MDW3709796.1 restriction endonuclease subunit S [Enterococcus faecium]
MSNDTQPEIRFPGFTEAWEERRLQEVVDRYDNLRIPITASKRVAGNTPYYGANGIQGYVEGYTHDGEFILVAEDGANDLKNYPVQYVDGKVWVNNHAHVIQAKENLADNMFLMNAIRSINIEPFLVGGGRAKLNADVLMKLEVIIPLKSEQQKIGSFFKQLDETITLHQRKLDLLKETKKGFLQKMFPKNGAKVPEIRFPGFTEDWEERRLQEVVDRYDNLRIPITASKRVAGNTPYYGANGIQGYVEGYTHDGEFILVAEDGANDLKNYPVQYVDGKVWVNNHAHVIQAKENLADNMFLMNAIRSINIEPFLVGGGRAKLNADVLMKLEVIIPLKSEQQKIGAFFKQLDDTIALHQRKLDLLKETKKGFLQKMFV